MPERISVSEHDTGAFGKIRVVHRDCPLCGRDNAASPAGPYSRGIWEVKTCTRCRFVYIEKAPSYEALFSDMAWERTATAEAERRAETRPISYRLSIKTRARMRLLPRKKMHLLIETYAKPGKVIDLGCGTGGQIADLAESFVPFGVEISTQAARAGNELFARRGGRVINAPSLEGLREFPAGYFSAASLRSYLEHEMEPAPVLRALHRTLEPGGVAVVKVPNYGSWNRMIMGRKWCGFRHPDHLNYFTPRTLREMAKRCGYGAWSGPTFQFPTSDNMYAVLTKI